MPHFSNYPFTLKLRIPVFQVFVLISVFCCLVARIRWYHQGYHISWLALHASIYLNYQHIVIQKHIANVIISVKIIVPERSCLHVFIVIWHLLEYALLSRCIICIAVSIVVDFILACILDTQLILAIVIH